MEGFGLFNLLKTFLPSDEKAEENAELKAVDSAPDFAPVPKGNEEEKPPEKPNACAEFLARHDARKKRLGK